MRPERGEAGNPHVGDRTSPETFGKEGEGEIPRDANSSDGNLNNRNAVNNDTDSEFSVKQAGVKRIEAVSKSWTKTSLIIAYVTYVSDHNAIVECSKLIGCADFYSLQVSHLWRFKSRDLWHLMRQVHFWRIRYCRLSTLCRVLSAVSVIPF